MAFKSGKDWNGNKGGRPKGSSLQPLLDAIKAVEKEKKIDFYMEAVKMALREPTVMNGIIKKLIPDQVEHGGFDGKPLEVKIKYA